MPALAAEIEFATARHPAVDEAVRRVLVLALDAVRCDGEVEAVLLTGSLARGTACGTVVDGSPLVLSDVDLVVVPRTEPSPALRDRLGRLSATVTRAGRAQGLVSHAEFGLVPQRVLARPRDRLFLHDLARTGRTLLGSHRPLARLRRALKGRRVDPEEGRILALNRVAGQIYMLPWVAHEDPLQRLVARYQFAKVYADAEVALRVVHGAYDRREFSHPVLDGVSASAERWAAFREAPPADPGPPATLLEEWKSVLRDQLAVASAAGGTRRAGWRPDPRHALGWHRASGSAAARPTLGQRLGFGGSPLDVAHARAMELAAALLAGPPSAGAWAEKAQRMSSLWRVALNGFDDTPEGYVTAVSGLIGGEA